MTKFNIITSFDNMPIDFLRKIRLAQVFIFLGFVALSLIGEYLYDIHFNFMIVLGLIFGFFLFVDWIIGIKLKKIGRFSFNELIFEKSIGDLNLTIDVEIIKLVNIEKHIVYLVPFFYNTMYRTFDVSIMTHDGKKEQFIVDNDNGRFLNEIKILKTKKPNLIRIGYK